MRHIQVGLMAVGLLAFGAGTAQAAGNKAENRGYAESLYAEYAAGAGGRVAFDVETLASGPLKQVANVPFGELVKATDFMVDADQVGTEVRAPRFVAPYATRGYDVYMASELRNTPAGFETVAGYPITAGTWRKLEVSTTIGSETRRHEALEFCWASLGHCTVLDPTVVFMESTAKNRTRLMAEGWGPKVAEEKRPVAQGDEPVSLAACGLASNPAYIGKSLTWGAWTQTYYNIYGGTLVRKSLGGQQSGVRCNSSCQPAPFGYSNVSSCQGFLGWSCSCDNDFGYGATGTTGKWIAETKCTHKFAFSASASASVSNYGSASVSINWTMDGTPDGNGGYYMDTCGYF
ncbi:hypothetical protein [Myxococcus sp. RHSTA-1-4]|uniref:hypothetical protein n=1 Tax=Myxococcus sp. RHSTA-1-4 TaxID=2874601 RepID=UPI001CBFD657|nr:hypothetical protein [Myxococcus sp. RHSTA-1-4]MBZ4420723.1 hypothetical protein [Myxococcus sp. RHSTA-1-4]